MAVLFLCLAWVISAEISFLHGKEVLWSRNVEAQLLQSMLIDSYRGKWFPMSNKIMPFDEFRLSGGRLHKEDEEEPFTGWYAQFDELNEPRMLCSFVDGKKNGFTYLWDGNGTRRFQGEYSDNHKDGEFIEWNKHAIMISQKNYLENKLNGNYLIWYETGKIKLEALFARGRLTEARAWYPDGRPCPYSKVINGRGVILRYKKDYAPIQSNKNIEGLLPNTFKHFPGIIGK